MTLILNLIGPVVEVAATEGQNPRALGTALGRCL